MWYRTLTAMTVQAVAQFPNAKFLLFPFWENIIDIYEGTDHITFR